MWRTWSRYGRWILFLVRSIGRETTDGHRFSQIGKNSNLWESVFILWLVRHDCILAAPTFIDSLLLKFFSEQTGTMSSGMFLQIGLVVTINTGWVAYAKYLERKDFGVHESASWSNARGPGVAANRSMMA